MTRSSRPPTPSASSGETLTGVFLTITIALLMVRWLIPAEAAETGEQLWLPAAWSLLAGAWLWFAPVLRRRWDWIDVSVTLLVLGHELGGLTVFVTGGQLRFAANLMCEWWGLACAWIVLRDAMVYPAWTASLQRALLAAAATVALLGIYQHYWGLPQSVREAVPFIEQYRAEQARGESGWAAWELTKRGIPTSEPALTLFEKRLRDSREPFGFFALANTLGGLLAASFVWGLASVVARCAHGNRRTEIGFSRLAWEVGRIALPLAAIAWCLALTKSRTAWVGAMVGVICLAGQWRRFPIRGQSSARSVIGKWLAASVVGVALLAVAMWGLSRSGGWDWQVLGEAGKSLNYRGQYWIGAGRLIAESPLVGRGLGQFREHYLRVKLPEASEEIADPHNLVLDAWVNGGLCGVAGLLGLAFGVFRSTGRLKNGPPATEIPSNAPPTKFVFIGGILAFVTALLAGLWTDGLWDDRYLVLGAAWCVLYWLWPEPTGSDSLATAAVVALGVHLLGAGGLGMPGVMQMGFAWIAAATETTAARAGENRRLARATAAAAVVAGLFVASAVWRPVMAAQQALTRGDDAVQHSDLASAVASYELSSTSDRWNPAAPGRLAELEFERFRKLDPSSPNTCTAESESFREALLHLEEAHRRDPLSVIWTRRTAELWLALSNRSHDPAHATRAAELFRTAVERYPTNAELLALLSDACDRAGDRAAAADAARRAVRQDDLNQQWGHVERVLPAAARQRLERRTSTPSSSATASGESGG